MAEATLTERFWAKVDRDGPDSGVPTGPRPVLAVDGGGGVRLWHVQHRPGR